MNLRIGQGAKVPISIHQQVINWYFLYQLKTKQALDRAMAIVKENPTVRGEFLFHDTMRLIEQRKREAIQPPQPGRGPSVGCLPMQYSYLVDAYFDYNVTGDIEMAKHNALSAVQFTDPYITHNGEDLAKDLLRRSESFQLLVTRKLLEQEAWCDDQGSRRP